MYNNGEGNGNINEVRNRRTWPLVNYWISDSALRFGEPALLSDGVTRIRNEYLYVGHTTSGQLVVNDFVVTGTDAGYFDVGTARSATIEQNGYMRIKVTFQSKLPVDLSAIDAAVEISLSGYGTQKIPITSQ